MAILVGLAVWLQFSGENCLNLVGQILLANCQQNWLGQFEPKPAKTDQNRPKRAHARLVLVNQPGWSSPAARAYAWAAARFGLSSRADPALYSARIGPSRAGPALYSARPAWVAGPATAPPLLRRRRSEWSANQPEPTKTSLARALLNRQNRPKTGWNSRGKACSNSQLVWHSSCQQHSSIDHSMVI